MAKKEYIGENRLSQLLTLLKSKIDAKVDKVTGKGLSTNDYTTAEKNKLASIPSIGNGTLKIQKNGTDVATFTANQAGNATANITVPTSKSDIGLGNVDNTSDANKPISTATQTALDGKVSKAGDTMTGQLKTSFKESVAMGSYQATATTIPDLVNELRFSSGCTGSAQVSTYTYSNITITGGWYNFLYMPHRSGGVNGAASGDNCNYGSLLLTGMTVSGAAFMIRVASNGTIQEVHNLYADTWRPVQNNLTSTSTTDSLSANQGRLLANGSARDSTKVAKSGDTMTGTLTFNKVNNAIAYTGTKATYNMIKFKDNTADTYGNGIVIGGGGLVVVGGGESADAVAAIHSTGGDEVLELAADGDVNIWTNVQNGTSSAKKFTFNAAGELNIPSGGKVVSEEYESNGSMNITADGIYLNARSDGYGTHVPNDIFTVGNYQRTFNRYGFLGGNRNSAITSGYLNSGGYRGYHEDAPSQFPKTNIPNLTIPNYASHSSSVFGRGCIAVKGSAAHAEGNNSIAIGGRSHAEGNTTLALGHASHAEGLSTLAGQFDGSGDPSNSTAAHAEGIETWARKSGSHAEGRNTRAEGEHSHAEGYITNATGKNSHAEGKQTDADGLHSHAEGLQTLANYDCDHAEGYYSYAHGYFSHAEGFRTTAAGVADHAEGACTIASSEDYSQGRHRGGAHAGGYKTKADASGAFAHGYMDSGDSGTTDWGSQSVDSLSIDLRGVLANGLGATAFGYKRKGIFLKSSGHGSFATGCVGPTDLTKPITETQIRNFYDVDFGIVASGDGSFAGGYTDATREMPIKATGKGAFAYGYGAIALGDGSVAMGYGCEAYLAGSCALGYKSVGSGSSSVAIGTECTAMSDFSIALGYELTANKAYLTTVGKYNKASSSSTDMLIVGKGTASNATANCFRVNQTAIYSTGAYNTSGADYAEMFEWADENVNAEDRRGRFVKLDGDKIVIADNIDDEILGVVSGNPSVCGDVQDDQWQGMYMYDIFGKPIYEDVEVEQEHYNEDTGEIETIKVIERQQKLNPEYDNTKEYIPRSERPEWDAVGMLGKLTTVDDGTCKVNEYAAPSIGGIATKSDTKTRFRVMKRLDSNHVKILILN